MLERRRFSQEIPGGWLLEVVWWVWEGCCGYGLGVGGLRWREEGLGGVMVL